MAVAWQRKWASQYHSCLCVLRNNDVNRQAKSVQATKYFLIALQLFSRLWSARWCKYREFSGVDMGAILQAWKFWPVAWRDTSSSKLKASAWESPPLLCVSGLWADGEYTEYALAESSDERLSEWAASRIALKIWKHSEPLWKVVVQYIQYFLHRQSSQKTCLFWVKNYDLKNDPKTLYS